MPELKNKTALIVNEVAGSYVHTRKWLKPMETTQTNPLTENTPEKFRGAADAAEQLIDEEAHELARATEQLRATAAAATQLAQTAFEFAGEQITAGAKATDQAIRRNPYAAAGIALGVGLLVGYLIKRK